MFGNILSLRIILTTFDGFAGNKILSIIDKAIKSTLQLRLKKIENFINTINTSTDVNSDWQNFFQEQKEVDIQELIQEEKLKSEETKKLMENAFRDGALKTTGTNVDKILPPVSRFGGRTRDKKKQIEINKLKKFFEKYFGIL